MRPLRRASEARPHRRAVRAVFVAVLAVAGSMIAQPPAQASTKSFTTDHDSEAWYWSSNRDVRYCDSTPANSGLCEPVPGPVLGTGPVSPGHLPVGVKNGKSDMRSYVQFSFGPDFIGAQAQSLIVSFTVSRSNDTSSTHQAEHAPPSANPPATINESAAKIRACLMSAAFGPAEGNAPDEVKDSHDPTVLQHAEPYPDGVDLSNCVEGRSGTAWTFDITPFARLWFSGQKDNNGIALLPDDGAAQTDNWTVEFHGSAYSVQNEAATGSTRVTYVSPSEQVSAHLKYEPAPVEKIQPTPPPPPVDTGGGVTAPPPVQNTTAPVPVASPSESATPTIAPTLPVAASKPTTPWYAWVMLPIGLIGFIALSRSLGRDESSVGASNNVATILRERRTPPSTGD